MARPTRVDVEGGWYHVTAREIERRVIFGDDREHGHFLELVGAMGARYGVEVHAAGKDAIASHDYSYVWSDGHATSSTSNRQYTVCATNGIRLLGGETAMSAVRVHGEARFESGIVFVAALGDISMGSFTNQMSP